MDVICTQTKSHMKVGVKGPIGRIREVGTISPQEPTGVCLASQHLDMRFRDS